MIEATRIVPVIFTEQELVALREDLANKTIELRQKEDHKKSVVSQLKAETDLLTAQTKLAADKIQAKCELRSVKCHVLFDWDAGTKQVVRIDTGEVVEKSNITDEERQQNLPLKETT